MEPQNPTQSQPAQQTIPQQNPVVTSPPQPSQRKLFLIVLAVILVVVVGAFGFYFFSNRTLLLSKLDMKLHPSPTPKPGCFYDEVQCKKAPCPPILMCPTTTPPPVGGPTVDPTIAGWKTYTDIKLNFEIKYPSGILAAAQNSIIDPVLGGVAFGNENASAEHPSSAIDITVYSSKNLSLEDWLAQYGTTQPFGSSNDKFVYGYKKIGTASLGGIQGISFQSETMGATEKNIAVVKNNRIYILTYIKLAYVQDDLLDTFNKMSATFKFRLNDQVSP